MSSPPVLVTLRLVARLVRFPILRVEGSLLIDPAGEWPAPKGHRMSWPQRRTMPAQDHRTAVADLVGEQPGRTAGSRLVEAEALLEATRKQLSSR